MIGTSDDHAADPASRPIPLISALVVEPIYADALLITSALSSRGLHVTSAQTFAKAKERLNARVPDVLIAAIPLAEYNGLQLVLRAKALRPEIAAIVLSPTADVVLQADSDRMGATFFVKPVEEKEIAAAVFRTLFRERIGSSEPLRAPFERRIQDRRAHVVPFAADRRRADRRRDPQALLHDVARRN